MKMLIWKCDAQGDTVYIEAFTQAQARTRLVEVMGDIPESLLAWSTVDKLPKGEVFL